ncbi:MAG: hypothetical protein H6811_00235 [Phycisphaeraceae bacterium]|nr:hypothetical protein [Phycisphaeraceae bacterium]
MERRHGSTLAAALSVFLAAGLDRPAWAYAGEGVVPLDPGEEPGSTPIRFNFKEVPFDQVLDFFSRESGLPIIREADVPKASMTFISGQEYSFEDALSILNLSLRMHNVHLRREQNFLYLSSTQEAFRRPTPVMTGDLPDGVTPDEIVTVTIPLNNAMAKVVAEQIKPLVGPQGAITPVDSQNMVILVETAGQVRRLSEIIRAIDSERPVDSSTRLFTLRYADPEAVVSALKTLIGERVRTVMVDQNGNRTVVEEVNLANVSMHPDKRTRTVLAVGPESRIDLVAELIDLLDVREPGDDERETMTFTLETVTAAEAERQLNTLFRNVPENRRPTVMSLPNVNKVRVVGTPSLIRQATALIDDMDPVDGSVARSSQRGARVAKVIRLEHQPASNIEPVLGRLLTPRQQQVVKYSTTIDRRGLILVGGSADVAAIEQVIAGLDVEPEIESDVRVVRLDSPTASASVVRAQELFAQSGRHDPRELTISFEETSGSLTLIGTREQLDAFDRLLRSVESMVVVERESRQYQLASRKPSELSQELSRLARPLLAPQDGSAYTAPEFEALDELDTLIVRAMGSQFTTIEELINRLDGPRPGDTEFRVLRSGNADVARIAARARELFELRAAAFDAEDLGEPRIEVDEASGSILVTARPEAMRLYAEAVTQAQQLMPPARTTRLIDVENLRASEIVDPLRAMLESADSIDPSRRVEPPTVSVVDRTNSLMVTAEPAQHALVQDMVRRLDRLEPTDLPPLKLLQLRTADANAIAAMLSQQYTQRPQSDRAARPVNVRADAATNTLIVSAHEDLFDEIRSFVDDLNTEREEGPERITFLFPLKVAKATDVATAMDRLYPEPPMPLDRRGQPMPWLRTPKEVTVSADASSNSLIIDAPADRRDSLEELAAKLDRVEIPPIAQLRTYRIEGADLTAIQRTLNSLAQSGNLAGPPTPGQQSVRVMIDAEPKSSTLIVAGDEVTFERVEAILADLSAVPIEKGLRIVPIANADAIEVRDRAVSIYDAQVAQIPGANPVQVTVDQGTNSLEVVADNEGMQRFMRILDELARQAGPQREVRLIELRFASATTAVAFLKDLVESSESFRAGGGAEPVFEAIEATNTLMVAAQPSHLPIIEALAKNLDNQQTGEQPPLRILRLRSTDAANLAQVLQSSFDRRPVDTRTREPVSVTADGATNTLIVSAHPNAMAEIEAIVGELNQQQAFDEQGREIRIFPLKIARAEELAKTIDEMFPEPPMPYDPRTRQARPDLRQPKEVVVRADRATNSLIVDAPGRRLAGFEQLVESLDRQKLAANVELRTYRVERAELNGVAQSLRQLAAGGALGTTGQTPVTIETEATSRSLIVSGPSEIFTQVERVLSELDQRPDRPETSLRLYALKHARAERVKPLLEQLLVTRIREQQEHEGTVVIEAQSLLEVASDPASNTLIVSAPEAIQAIAEQLIEALDVEAAAAGRSVIRVVPLTYADASQVAQTLQQARPGIDWPSGGENLTIIAAAGSNALLLTGAENDLKKLEELIEPLDRRPSAEDAPGVETFALEHAEAGQIAQTVERLLGDQLASDPRVLAAQLRYYRGVMPRQATVRVQADTRTNSLIVSGPTASLELAKAIIDRLDQPSEEADRTVATFTPTKGDPATLATLVSRVVDSTMARERRAIELVPEARSGSVVAIGSREQVAEAVRLLAEFDDRSVAVPAVDLALLDVANTDARSLASSVQSMLDDRTRWPDALRRAERAGLGVPSPRVNADPAGNRLLVSAPTALMPLARDVVATLDRPVSSGQSVEVRVFRMTKGDAESAAGALRDGLSAGLPPGEKPATITAEPASNSVVVAATSAQLERAAALIKEMDAAIDTEGLGVRTVFLRNARADAIAPLVERVLTKESEIDLIPEWQRWNYLSQRRRGDQGGIEQPVRVVAEGRLNAIVVSGPVAALDLAEQMVQELDVEPSTGTGRIVRVLTPVNSDVTELAASIEAVLADDEQARQPPVIRVDTASNSLIVRATPDQMESIEGLVDRLDSATLSASREMRMIRVDRSRVSAAVMAQTLRQLLEQSGGVKVEVISVDDLLREPATESAPGSPGASLPSEGVEWCPPARGKIDIIRRLVESSVVATVGTQPERGEQPADDAGVTIAVDPQTNSLLIVGSSRLAQRLAELVKELEGQIPSAPAGVRVVTLPQDIDPNAVAGIVRETIRQVGRATDENPGGFTGSVSVAPDPLGGSVIVWANDEDFRVLRQIIASVARPGAATQLVVKVYPLANVEGDDAVRAVRDLVSQRPQGRQAQRLRELDLTLDGSDVRAQVDPSMIAVSQDPAGAALIVTAPPGVLPLIDAFVEVIDQSTVMNRLSIRRYQLSNAKPDDLARTLQTLFDAQRQGTRDNSRARFVPDDRTNAILVTATDDQHREVVRLLETADVEVGDDDLVTKIFTLQQAEPSTVERVLEQILIGRDEAKRERIQISADDSSSVLVLRAPQEAIDQAAGIVDEVDRAEATGFPLRVITLEQADAQTVAQSLERFFQQRARVSSRQGRRAESRVAIVGDRRSGTLLVASSDEDFAQIESLVETFDRPAAGQALQIKIIPLQNARVSDLEDTITTLAFQLQSGGNDWWVWPPRSNDGDDKIIAQVNERTNSVILMGNGESFETMERVVASLDLPASEQTRQVVEAIRLDRADLNAVARVVEGALATPNWRSWQGRDPDGVSIEVDRQRRLLIVVGKRPRVEMAMEYIRGLEESAAGEGAQIESITLTHAQADRAARSLQEFFRNRARTQGLPENEVAIVGSPEGNVLIVSGDRESMGIVHELVAHMDQPELGDDRSIQVYTVKNAAPEELARTVTQMFPQTRPDERIIVTPQPSTNSLIVSAPTTYEGQIKRLIDELDRPPSTEDLTFKTVSLNSARAGDVAQALRDSLPPGLKVQITPVTRSNALFLTGSLESIALVEEQIRVLDTEPVRTLQEFRGFALENAKASDVWFTLSGLMRNRRGGPNEPAPSIDYTRDDNTIWVSATADQMREVETIIEQLDVARDSGRTTEFIKLEFADAKATATALGVFYGSFAPEASSPGARSVTIVPDPASNTLVISAGEKEWEGIRALLAKLDTEAYDTSRQIEVIPLKHADAASVARALNEGLGSAVARQIEEERARAMQDAARRGGNPNDRRDQPIVPPVLVQADETPVVSAEIQTNALIVFAGRKDMERIRAIVRQLDVPDILKLPQPRVIALRAGRASRVAQAVREAFSTTQRGIQSRRGVLIYGDDESNTIIVRADEEEFAQIAVLAESLQDHASDSRLSPRVLRVSSVPAARLRQTVISTFQPIAQQDGEGLTVEIDRASNALIVASSERLFTQIEAVVKELDGGLGADGRPIQPGLGQAVLIIDVKNMSPSQVRQLLTDMGVTRPAPDDRPGLVSEPVTIVPLTSRQAVAVVASPADGQAIVEVIRAIDQDPPEPEQRVEMISLKLADARGLVATLEGMLDATRQSSPSARAAALAEQIRRLSIAGGRWDQAPIDVDLTQPIRLSADTQTNSVMVASTPGNVRALSEIVSLLDTLPLGDAVVVRFFPLENASASRVRGVIDELFRQGEALRRLPGTQRRGLPSTTTGQALAGEIAVSVDERTNALVVAGREEAVALVEVLVSQLDSDEIASWVEPTLVPLKHADPVKLAQTLSTVLRTATSQTPEALGLQQQVARLRVLKSGGDPTDPSARLQADLFAPMSSLVVVPESNLGALIVIASPGNAAVVRELVAMLDVEAAGADNEVRVFPLEHAAADRIAQVVRDVFREREQVGAIRQEDRLIVTADVRTNALIVSTSPRSLEVLLSLLETLDTPESDESVGVHVVPVTGADVRSLAPTIERLMRERISALRRSGVPESPSDALSIAAEPTSNALIIAASDENLETIRELISSLSGRDRDVRGGERSELVYVEKGQAQDLAEAINELYVRRENERRGQGSVSVIANDRLNVLIVTGTEADAVAVRDLVQRLSQAEVKLEQDIRRIELKTANALEVVNLLGQVLAGRNLTGGRANGEQATRLRYFRNQLAEELREDLPQSTEAEIDGALRQQVRLTPDLRTNSVVVAAPPQLMSLISQMIQDLDSTTAGSRNIEMYRLNNADAFAMAEVLRDLFNLRQQGNTFVLIPTPTPGQLSPEGDENDLSSLFGGASVTPVPDERQELSITIDPRTNTLLVSGTAEYLGLVRKVVTELDTIEATERERYVYHLKNARAKEVEETLRSYFQEEAERIRDTLRPEQIGSLARLLEQEVTLVGDEKSNKLVVSASPRYIETVREVIEELDAAPPQVVIQVLLAEVTIDRGSTWGVDFEVGPFGGDGYKIASSPAGAAIATALGVPNLAVSSGDFSLLVRALEEQGRLEVLSRPQVTVNNNERALIQVGENIAVVESVDTFDNGRSQANVVREDVGIILEVTPTISNDGFVRMDISPEISSVSARTTQISQDFEAPIINQRRVETTVTILDGQTVVIGGLLQTSDDQRNTKMPIVGQIPVFGELFRTREMSNIKTELLIILTPTVIRGGRDSHIATQRSLSDRAIDEMAAREKIRELLRRATEIDGELEFEPWTPMVTPDENGLVTPPAKDGGEELTQPLGDGPPAENWNEFDPEPGDPDDWYRGDGEGPQ